MLTIDFINVGYGDAILIREQTGSSHFCMLVDCGDTAADSVPANSCRTDAAAYLNEEGVSHIDLLVLTHLHRDHIGGMERLLERVTIDGLWTPYLPPPELRQVRLAAKGDYSKTAKSICQTLNMLLDAAEPLETRGCRLTEVHESQKGYRLTPALSADISCQQQYLYARQRRVLEEALLGRPDRFELDYIGQFTNITGIRLRLTYHGRAIVLPADVYAGFWDYEQNDPCYILKVPHHACGGALTEELLKKLRPEHAVVSVSNDRGDNRPSAEAIGLLKQYAGSIQFTDAVSILGMEAQYHSSVRFVIE